MLNLTLVQKINALCPGITKILAQGLQRYNSPANWATKMFKLLRIQQVF